MSLAVPLAASGQNSTPPATWVPSSAVECVASTSKKLPLMVTLPLVEIEEGESEVTCGGWFATTVNAPMIPPLPPSGSLTETSYGPPGTM